MALTKELGDPAFHPVKWKLLSHVPLFATCGLYSPWNSPGQNTGVGSLSLIQWTFPTRRSNPGLPHCRWVLYQLSHKRSPGVLEWAAYPFSRGSSWPRNQTGVSCIAGGFFTSWATNEFPFHPDIASKLLCKGIFGEILCWLISHL